MEEKNKPKNITPRTQMKIKQYFMRGLTSFLVILAGIVCYFAFLRLDDIAGLLGKIGGILQPIILGLVFAYLLSHKNVREKSKKQRKTAKSFEKYRNRRFITRGICGCDFTFKYGYSGTVSQYKRFDYESSASDK